MTLTRLKLWWLFRQLRRSPNSWAGYNARKALSKLGDSRAVGPLVAGAQ